MPDTLAGDKQHLAQGRRTADTAEDMSTGAEIARDRAAHGLVMPSVAQEIYSDLDLDPRAVTA